MYKSFLHFFSECPTGQFGKNCSEFCEGCLSRMCSNVDGLCENTTACNPGYIYEEYCNKSMYSLCILIRN